METSKMASMATSRKPFFEASRFNRFDIFTQALQLSFYTYIGIGTFKGTDVPTLVYL